MMRFEISIEMNMKKLVLLLVILCTMNAWSQSETVLIDHPEDREVTISASRSQAKLESMPVSTVLITKEDIQKSPATTLDQLLRMIPGINLSGAPFYTSDPTGTSLKMRGLANAKVLVMLDGIPIHDPFYSTIQWFKVPLSSIDHIEVVRGGGSSLWGNLAVAGVINIISKKPEGNGGEISASAGNMSTENFSIAKNIEMNDKIKFRITIDYFNTDAYTPTPVWFNGFYKLSAGQGTNSDNQVNLRLDSSIKVSEYTSGFFKMGIHQQNQYLINDLGQNLQQTFDASGGINSRLSDNSSIDAKLWYQNVIFNKNNATGCWPGMNTTTGLYAPTNASYNTKCGTSLSTNVGPSGSAPIYQYVSQTDYQPYSEIGSSLVYTNRYDQGTSTVGIDSRRISATDSQLNYGSPTVTNGQVTVTPGTNTYIYSKATQQFWGVFYEQKYRPIDAIEATLGLRIDSWTNSNGSISINNSFNVQPDQTQYSFDPSLSFKYYATDIWSLRSSIYKGFRAPGLNNMYRSYGSTATGSTNASISNPNLSPETLYGWEIGTDYKSSAVDISFTYYNLFVENMNYSMALSNTSTGIAAQYYRTITSSYGISATSFNYYSDLFDSRSTGIELGTKWYVAPNLKIIANFIYTNTYLTSTIDPLKNPSFTQLGGVSPNVGILGLDWQITPKLSTYWQVRAVSQAFLDTAQTTMMPGYATVDFNVMYHIDNKTTLTTNVINLFNQGYYTDGGSSSTTPTLGMPILVMVGAKHLF